MIYYHNLELSDNYVYRVSGFMKNNFIGSALTLTSALIYAIQTALIKGWGKEISIPIIIFIQSVACMILIMPAIFAKGSQRAKQLMKTNNVKIHFLRTVFSLGISYFLFSAVKFIPLVDAALLTNTAPLIMPFLGWLFLSQKINHRLWLPLIIGFIGIILVLRPNGEVFQAASLLGLGAAVCMAASIMLIRRASKTDSALTNVFYYFLFSLPISAIIAAIFWNPISWHAIFIVVGIGVLFFSVQMTLVYATKFVSAQTVGSLYLFNIVFSALIGWMVWHAALTPLMILGVAVTIIGAIYTIQAQTVKAPASFRVETVNE
jgi:drug/metabolite transporter (DMT)-like permease